MQKASIDISEGGFGLLGKKVMNQDTWILYQVLLPDSLCLGKSLTLSGPFHICPYNMKLEPAPRSL